jgi:hypothetical protein
MSTSTLAGSTGLNVRGGRLLLQAAVVTGTAFAAEAVASVFVDAHVGYHSLNSVLNLALLISSVGFALSGKAVVGRAGVIGGWATALMAVLAGGGGIWAVMVEGFTSSESPGVVEGIAHTAVLASMLFMIPLGIGLRGVNRVSGLVIAASSACLVAMVLAGLDQPEMFLAPEAALGIGWLLLSRALPAGDPRR